MQQRSLSCQRGWRLGGSNLSIDTETICILILFQCARIHNNTGQLFKCACIEKSTERSHGTGAGKETLFSIFDFIFFLIISCTADDNLRCAERRRVQRLKGCLPRSGFLFGGGDCGRWWRRAGSRRRRRRTRERVGRHERTRRGDERILCSLYLGGFFVYLFILFLYRMLEF